MSQSNLVSTTPACLHGVETIKEDNPNVTGPEHDEPYPLYTPGVYEARCVRARVYRHPCFRAWKCELRYVLISSGKSVTGFFHLGTGDKPIPARGSKYRRAWIIASGEKPRKRQKMSHTMFLGKIFEVRIDDTTRTWDQREHLAAERYSTVKDILTKKWP